MTHIPNKLLMSITLSCVAIMLQTAHAEQRHEPVTTPGQFIIQLPDVDRETLVEQVRVLRSQLIERKQALLQIVADRKLNSNDAIITAILPGGLLYASYKKVRYEQAKNELDRVGADIEAFSGDLLAMQSGLAPVVVALQP